MRRRLVLVLNTVPQLPQEEASICPLATTRPPLRRSPLTARQLQQSTNQSPRPLTHSMIICALGESVPFVLGYSGLGKKQVQEHDGTTCGRQVKVYLHFYKTLLQVIVVLSSRQSIHLVPYKEPYNVTERKSQAVQLTKP